MKKILVATEFAAPSKNSLAKVIELLDGCDEECSVTLLNTYLLPPGTPNERVIQEMDRIKTHSKELLQKEKELLLASVSNPNVKIETLSRLGAFQNVVSQMIDAEDFTCVALGPERHIQLSRQSGARKNRPTLVGTR